MFPLPKKDSTWDYMFTCSKDKVFLLVTYGPYMPTLQDYPRVSWIVSIYQYRLLNLLVKNLLCFELFFALAWNLAHFPPNSLFHHCGCCDIFAHIPSMTRLFCQTSEFWQTASHVRCHIMSSVTPGNNLETASISVYGRGGSGWCWKYCKGYSYL